MKAALVIERRLSARTSLARVLLAGILTFFSIKAIAEEPVMKGRLCFMTGENVVDVSRCAEVRGLRIEVEPVVEARRYVWSRSDGKQLVLAVLEAEANRIDLEGVKGTIRLELDGNVSRGWPAFTEVRVEGKGVVWPLALTGGHASQLREIRLPHGGYAIRVNAEHHQPHTLDRTVVDASPVDLGTIALQARPRFLATVQREDGTPLGGATLLDDFGKLLAKADALGQLEYETACEEGCFLPGRVAIDYPGHAGTRILIADPRRDFAAGAITLGMGGALELTVKRPDDERFSITVRVMEVSSQGEEQTPRIIAEKVIPADSDRLRLEMLPVGRSSLYLNGSEPGQVLSRYVFIKAGEVASEEVTLRPTEVSVHVSKAGAAVSGAKVTVGVPHGSPDYDIALPATDADGRVSTTIWQSGTMVATASVGEIGETVFFQASQSRREEVEIQISPTVLRGRVYDGDTGEPLKKTSIRYTWNANRASQYGSVLTDENGRYEQKGARAGVHTLAADLPDYLPAESKVETTGGENERVLDLVLTRGEQHKVKLQWRDGTPIRGATIMQVIDSGQRYRRWKSDSAGELTINLAKQESIEVWIVPTEGSFGVVMISKASAASITLPPPTGALIVKSVNDSGEPMPSSHLGVRYQGKALDYAVMATIGGVQGNRFRTGSNGIAILRGVPAGQYEIWATQYDGDDLIMGGEPRPPVTSFFHSGGEQSVSVEADRFAPRD